MMFVYIRGTENSIQIGNICFDSNMAIRLPPNFSILATMNTSDQNVFTLDNAFQRRFDMGLVRNEFDLTQPAVNTQYNAEITATLKGLSSTEDKRLGVWFVSNVGGIIAAKVQEIENKLREEFVSPEQRNISVESVSNLEHTENFTEGGIKHIFEGEINHRGEAKGYHYEGIANTAGQVIPGTRTAPNAHGVYRENVMVNGVAKRGFSTFFPAKLESATSGQFY